jgi:hypothetical protein
LPEVLFDRPKIAEKVLEVKEPRRARWSLLLSVEELLPSDMLAKVMLSALKLLVWNDRVTRFGMEIVKEISQDGWVGSGFIAFTLVIGKEVNLSCVA